MTLEEQLAQLRKEAATLRDKALNKAADFTAADGARAEQLGKAISDTEKRITAKNAASAALGPIAASAPGGSSTDNDKPADDPRQPFRAAAHKAAGATGGQHERAAAFAGEMRKALDAAANTVGGPAAGKALVPQGAVAFGFDGRIIEDPKAEYSLPAAVNTRPIDTPNGSYLRQVLRENNAATVARGQLKPISRYALEPVNWHAATIAHLAEPVPVQHFQDYNSLDRFLASEMAYGLESAVSDFILRGGIAEDGSTVEGILTTPGVLQTAYGVSAMQSVRRALGQLEAEGVTATGIVMHPEAWMDIELSTDGEGRFLLGPNQPTAAPARTLWNRPVTLTTDIPVDQAVVGDLSTVTLLTRSSALLAWNPFVGLGGTEAAPTTVSYFRRNLIEPRLEVRVALEVSSPKSLRVVDLTAA